ncbi:alpha/beta hydrolase [Flavobacterium macacae]|uniref:Alpha/beta hydrolase n=1 Tax=Flavobacterium macacae TaxID=2488993 RepID=A0A3P3W093_9FLAO|nr:alpha/beta hydrolase [Flavobacterium macacae]RRJ88400.1 alpha/beta hydrolase [Flavobacterium macacae]
MKSYLFVLFLAIFSSCSPDDSAPVSSNLNAETLLDVPYGTNPQQLIDIYLPARRTSSTTKVLFLVHGGGWKSGSKNDMTALAFGIRSQFPDYAIVNIGYRLGTLATPAYPNQINDIQSVVSYLKNNNFNVSKQYGFLGISAGAHLSMLYSYKFDTEHNVKAVCSIVGPTDFTDPAYENHEAIDTTLPYLIGQNPPESIYAEISPITFVSAHSASTIQFAGNQDPLIPTSQGTRLKQQLDTFNITNELHVYNAGHGDFNPVDAQDINVKLIAFLTAHL